MPHVKIYGVTPDEDMEAMVRMREEIRQAMFDVKELRLTSRTSTTVRFVAEVPVPPSPGGSHVTVEILLYKKPERTDRVINKVAQEIRTVMEKYFPLVEVFPQLMSTEHASRSVIDI